MSAQASAATPTPSRPWYVWCCSTVVIALALLICLISARSIFAPASPRDQLPAVGFEALSLLILVLELMAVLRYAIWATALLVAALLLALLPTIGNAAEASSPRDMAVCAVVGGGLLLAIWGHAQWLARLRRAHRERSGS